MCGAKGPVTVWDEDGRTIIMWRCRALGLSADVRGGHSACGNDTRWVERAYVLTILAPKEKTNRIAEASCLAIWRRQGVKDGGGDQPEDMEEAYSSVL